MTVHLHSCKKVEYFCFLFESLWKIGLIIESKKECELQLKVTLNHFLNWLYKYVKDFILSLSLSLLHHQSIMIIKLQNFFHTSITVAHILCVAFSLDATRFKMYLTEKNQELFHLKNKTKTNYNEFANKLSVRWICLGPTDNKKKTLFFNKWIVYQKHKWSFICYFLLYGRLNHKLKCNFEVSNWCLFICSSELISISRRVVTDLTAPKNNNNTAKSNFSCLIFCNINVCCFRC